MKTKINPPKLSKINWTAFVMQAIGMLAIMGIIPEDIKEQVTEFALLLLPMLIQIFRTYFTEAKTE